MGVYVKLFAQGQDINFPFATDFLIDENGGASVYECANRVAYFHKSSVVYIEKQKEKS